jgi:hypothetical protein
MHFRGGTDRMNDILFYESMLSGTDRKIRAYIFKETFGESIDYQ